MIGDNKTYASFSVDDFAAAKDFYCDKLGMKVASEDGKNGVMILESGVGTRAIVYEKQDHQAWNATVFGVETDDIDAALAQVREQGIEPEVVEGMTGDDRVMRDPDMGNAFWIKDPAGNWLIVGRFAVPGQ